MLFCITLTIISFRAPHHCNSIFHLSFTVLAIMTVDKFEELWEPAAEKTQPASAQ